MKKKTISLILALILLLSCSATAQATSVQAATPSASITINGTTATCRVSIAKPGKTIHATLQLWQGRTMIDSWSGNGTSYLLITGSHEVTKGKTYTVKVVCTVDGQSFNEEDYYLDYGVSRMRSNGCSCVCIYSRHNNHWF